MERWVSVFRPIDYVLKMPHLRRERWRLFSCDVVCLALHLPWLLAGGDRMPEFWEIKLVRNGNGNRYRTVRGRGRKNIFIADGKRRLVIPMTASG